MNKLKVFICENFYPEYQAALLREGINDVELRLYPTLCDHKGRKNEAKEILSQTGMNRSVLICNQSCDARKLIQEDGFIETVTGNYCFTHLTCDEFLDYLTSQGSYILSLGWLKQWKKHLASMGFEKETARRFFQETTKQITFLDAKIDDEAEALLAELSAYLDIPYVMIPVELETIRQLLKSKRNEWQHQLQNKENARVINELRSQLADYAAFFDMIGKISTYTSERDVINKVKNLFVMIFGAQKFRFWNEHSEPMPMEIRELISNDDKYLMLKNENRFCIQVSWDGVFYGVLDTSEFLFPQYIDRYLNLALDITKFLGLVLHNNDQYEKIAESKEEAESANNAKSRYLAHMNHEIRTPLNGFVGFLQLMETTRLDQLQQEYMHHMKQSTSHLLGIINNVLDMARIEAGEMKLTKRLFNLEDEIQTALAPLRSLARQKNIRLLVNVEDHMPPQVEGDPDRLRQILLNLGGNAVKFTQEGQVNITIQCLETTEEKHTLQMAVEDTGPGMTRETLDKLFMPFYQVDDGSTSQSKGTGLGMTITQELVELMGGHIQAESTPGRGTRVEVRLMLNKVRDSLENSPQKRPDSTRSPMLKQPRILVVEDNKFNQIILRRILENKGLPHDVVGDGQQAVEKVGKNHYDLIFMDIQLPLMDGIEATRQIRRLSEISQPIIIAVTAYTSWKDQKACKAAGMNGFLTKPITLEDIANVLDNEAWILD